MNHTASSLPAVNAATHCDNSLPLLSSQRSPSQLQAPPKSQHRLSLGKRIKRSLSINFFRKNIDGTSTAPSYPKSDPGHDGAFPRPASIVHPFTPWLQYEPEGDQQRSRPRKLKKRTPSISGSAALAPGSSLTSMSTPALHRSPSIPREPLLAADVRSQDTRPSEQPSPRLAHKHRSKSTPTTFERPNTPPPMPPLPGVVDTTGSVTARATQSQPSTPTSHLVRKLTKRRVRGKKIPSALDDQPDLLPPMRALSPFDLDVKGRRLSDASRSHSAPNLGPADPTSVHHSRYFTFVTESPPSSPLASDSAADGPSHAEFLQMKPLGNTDRPSFLRSQSNRRWTLAVSEAPEEELVEELDRLRDVGWSLGFQGELIRVKDKRVKAQSDDGDPPGQATGINWEKEELEEWLVARKALMVCREIVRTEKSYREGLVRLQRGETLEAPPPLLLQYIPALISASLAFSARLDDDPSPWGVSVAFLGAEDALEVALVAWSGIVGDYFGINVGKSQRQWSVDPKVNEKEKKAKEKEGKTLGPPVLTPVTYSDDGHGRGQLTPLETKGIQGSWRMSMPALSQLLTNPTDLSLSMNRKSRSPLSPITAAIKTPTVQDLAIQPTQRVMRYVLLYKDLLNSTPITSPARALAERALEGATRIAQRCNRAQDNAAFLT
ncbi:hypothetical protein K439DRAFT_1084974 [Ramaria rubella]|nr:hypothetical protein K439DRAFT_1084974 [Ramaria rubella]